MKKLIIIILFFDCVSVFAQNDIFKLNLQSKNSLVEFLSRGKDYGYWQYTKEGDSVKLARKKYPTKQIDILLDSLKKLGFKDKNEKLIKKSKYTCDIKLLDFKYFDHDTLKDKSLDTIYIVKIEIKIVVPKIHLSMTKTYLKVYTHFNETKLKKLFDNNDWFNLYYFSRANIYRLNIDFSCCQYFDRNRSGWQPAQYFERVHF